ncbi:MAG: phosphoribosylaminoimidazolesuccinocarboxamide synthase [Deltaproteobacteria bacterium]|jgi:phosphoribosylaminoimidazole-succinocarboxamide synthase|nr:phosphoribosylaminoimidazolesuccinocarboxamide synthase [Deltaproteobacteria bacterium]MBW2184041.1 phosphoribosylaminoimidazolesuccinocarboxamide synthase [Deltaproteobacteria bacterium]
MSESVALNTDFKDLTLLSRGKVRDIYDLNDMLLIVATDRISAFDVILPNGIPYKGKVLSQMSAYWFEVMGELAPHHLISIDTKDFPSVCQKYESSLKGRSMLVKKAKPLPVECVVRGYLAGSGWKEYQDGGSICGIPIKEGLRESSQLEKPIFTPATKAELGDHDENITFEKAKEIVGDKLAERLKEVSLALYKRGSAMAREKGIIISDTKFEFGLLNEDLILIDEVLTPDSSRFWPEDEYEPGRSQKSFDKQFVRDYLLTLTWDKTPPGPNLPEEIIKKTSERYLEAFRRLTERELE